MLRRGIAVRTILYCVLLMPSLAWAQDLPVTMILSGAVSPSSDGKVVPTTGDTVLAINALTGAQVGSGSADATGYGMIISNQPSSLNGKQLLLQFVHGGVTFKLLLATGGDAIVVFNGSFLPVRATANLVASSVVIAGGNPGGGTGGGTGGGSGGGTTPPPTTPPPTSLTGDINGDGVIDEKDIQLLKRAISGQIPIDVTKMDINGDGVVNTRDLIDLIRAIATGVIKQREDLARGRSSATMQGPASSLPTR